MYSTLLCHSDRAVSAAIVYHQVFDFVHPGQGAGQISHCLAKGGIFVIAGDLNDKFHL
jgi:hypothetical protein